MMDDREPSDIELIAAVEIQQRPQAQDFAIRAIPSFAPPSFDESQSGIIYRRQHQRPKDGGGLKLTAVPSRFFNLSNDFEFAGWGNILRMQLSAEDMTRGGEALQSIRREGILGQWTASALAANDILGGVFYTLPAVVGVSSVYSPISLFIATLTLFFWRPIMEELGSALVINGAPYTYLLNVSTKSLALLGAALMLLDFASTAVVSAATAALYVAGETSLPFPTYVGTVLVFTLFTGISLAGLRESARVAGLVLGLHLLTMIALVLASVIAWARHGNEQLHANWVAGSSSSVRDIARSIFYGICIGMLGLTGFECAPSYIAKIRPGRYPAVLRNLHIPAIVLNAGIMLLVLALLPLEAILTGANVLSLLAQVVAGRWLRIWVVVDAVIVLCGGVLTGILSACELLEQLCRHRVIPDAFHWTIPITGAPYVAVLSFVAFSGVLYASTAAQLSIISKMFSLVWLTVMTLFPLSLLLLKFNRGRLPRNTQTSLFVIFAALIIAIVVIAGNIAVDPSTAGYFAAYFFAIFLIFSATQNKARLLRWLYWAYDQTPLLHLWPLSRRLGQRLTGHMKRLKRQPVCILVKTDEINYLFQMIIYVRQNEETSCLKMVHFYNEEKDIPSEMEANAKILDEAFPEITVDLVLVQGPFDPHTLAALAHRLQIPPSLMFMSCPSANFAYPIADFGARIISL